MGCLWTGDAVNPDLYHWLIVGLVLLPLVAMSALAGYLLWRGHQSRSEFAHDDARAAIREAMEGTL